MNKGLTDDLAERFCNRIELAGTDLRPAAYDRLLTVIEAWCEQEKKRPRDADQAKS